MIVGTLIPSQFMGKLRGEGSGEIAQTSATKMKGKNKQTAKANSICMDPCSIINKKWTLVTE